MTVAILASKVSFLCDPNIESVKTGDQGGKLVEHLV